MGKTNLIIKIVTWNSPEYSEVLRLRDEILRKPLGMSIYQDDLSKENEDVHVGAFMSGELVACLLLRILSSKTIQMKQVAVRESYQGKHIGQKLVGFSEKYAIQYGFTKMMLHARDQAIGFYEKLHYTVVSGYFTEVGIPHRKMEKILKDH